MQTLEESSGKIKEPVIVVSDVHLGRGRSNFRDFWGFLDWLTTLPVDGKTLKCNSTELTIKKPGTIVLLGDILDLWHPKRHRLVQYTSITLSLLHILDCNIIYVLGDHDWDLLDIKKLWEEEGEKAEFKFTYKEKETITIAYPKYPSGFEGTKEIRGMQIGKMTYAFLHGHQFKRLQFLFLINKVLKNLKMPVRLYINCQERLKDVVSTKYGRINLNTIILSFIVLIYLSLYYRSKAIPVGSSWGILWVIISSFFIIRIIPSISTFFRNYILQVCTCFFYNKIWLHSPEITVKKCTTIEHLIKTRYANKKGDKIDADIIVLGHTHNAGTYYKEDEKRLFINTGCWVSECAEEKRNTFLYIDVEVPYLLKWDKEKIANGEITCLEDLSAVVGH